jgi:protein-disulfide isomerase
MSRVPRHATRRRSPLSGKQSPDNQTRRQRRAAERRDRFETAREERRARAGSSSGGGPSWLNTKTIMIGATIVGVLIVVFVAANQLGNRVTGTFDDPGINYPEALLDGRTIGSADAPVTLEVWEDYQCPACASHTLGLEPLLVDKYVRPGILRIVKQDLAFLGRGGPDDESVLAASGAVCANKQDKFWDYALWVYNNQDGENAGGFARGRLKAIAEAAGVDVTNWDSCVDAPETVAEVTASTTKGGELGITSTPTLFLGDQKLVGVQNFEELGALIEAEAAKASASPGTSPAAESAAP